MFSAITTMLSSVGGLATSYIDGKTAVQKAEAQILMKEATGDIDWDLAAIRATQSSWKDEYILILYNILILLNSSSNRLALFFIWANSFSMNNFSVSNWWALSESSWKSLESLSIASWLGFDFSIVSGRGLLPSASLAMYMTVNAHLYPLRRTIAVFSLRIIWVHANYVERKVFPRKRRQFHKPDWNSVTVV